MLCSALCRDRLRSHMEERKYSVLELKHIHKDYPAGEGKVNALRGISLQFREAEFVSILGPSGCGTYSADY